MAVPAEIEADLVTLEGCMDSIRARAVTDLPSTHMERYIDKMKLQFRKEVEREFS